jgi:hypothetical protein
MASTRDCLMPTLAHPRHGLGDTALSDGISEFIDDIKAVHPGIFVHSVQIPQGGSDNDERRAGFVRRPIMSYVPRALNSVGQCRAARRRGLRPAGGHP